MIRTFQVEVSVFRWARLVCQVISSFKETGAENIFASKVVFLG